MNNPIEPQLRLHQIEIITGLSGRTLHTLWKRGEMPEPVRLGRSLRWDPAKIKAWVATGTPPVAKKSQAAEKAKKRGRRRLPV